MKSPYVRIDRSRCARSHDRIDMAQLSTRPSGVAGRRLYAAQIISVKRPAEGPEMPRPRRSPPCDSPWLSPPQLRAWMAYMRVQLRMNYEINRQLQRDSGLSLADYHVLNALSNAPDHKLQVTDLAALIGWERSRVSHQVRRLCES